MIDVLLRQFLNDHQIRNGRLLIGVSGGADSVALLRGLLGVQTDFGLDLVAAHYDHALRPESAQDARWVSACCQELRVPCISERRLGEFPSGVGAVPAAPVRADDAVSGSAEAADAPAISQPSEEASRKSRYEFIVRTAKGQACRWVALAHTADDQAETVLHHILRGSGLKGASGMPAMRRLDSNVMLIRPLLAATRRDVLEFLESLGQPYLTDESNRALDFTRNRIRKELIPWLRERFNPRVKEALLRLSAQAAAAQETIETLAEELLTASLLDRQKAVVRLKRDLLPDRPLGLLRELFSLVWQQQDWPRQGMTFAHFDRLADAARTGARVRIALPGRITADCREGVLELRRVPRE